MDVEEDAGTEHQEPDPHHAAEQRHEEPIDNVGDELAPAPPRRPWIAGPEMREHREPERQQHRHGHHLLDGLTEHQDDFKGKTGHSQPFESNGFKAYSSALK